jgi:hypothetical protein
MMCFYEFAVIVLELGLITGYDDGDGANRIKFLIKMSDQPGLHSIAAGGSENYS